MIARLTYLVALPLLITKATASSADEIESSLTGRILSALHNDEEERQLLNIFSRDHDIENAPEGTRCGEDSGNTCAEGLDCAHVGFGHRCTPQTKCLEQGVVNLQERGEKLKEMIFGAANITEQDIVDARVASPHDDAAFVESTPIRALVKAMKDHERDFDFLDDLFDRCSPPAVESTTNSLETLSKMEEEALMPSSNTTEQSVNDSHTQQESATTGSGGHQRRLQAPTPAPTLPDITTPNDPDHTWYFGWHIEGGPAIEGSLSLFWERGSFHRTYLRLCVGVEVGGGIESGFIAIRSRSGQATDIICNHGYFDVDVGLVFGVGAGLGICGDGPNPGMLYFDFTATIGAGVGVGFDYCNVQSWTEPIDDFKR